MQHVAFLRNVNQGQRGHPSTGGILTAFADAGCADAMAFRSNGTILFTSASPHVVVPAALVALAERTGVEREGYWMPLPEVARIVGAHASEADAGRRELTLHAGGRVDLSDSGVVDVATHRRCRIVEAGDGWLVSVNERQSESNATPVIERLTGRPATSRGLPTLVRLVDRFGRPDEAPSRRDGRRMPGGPQSG